MTQYRVRSSEGGSSVEMLTSNRGWVEMAAFTNPDHRQDALHLMKHYQYLDQLDNG